MAIDDTSPLFPLPETTTTLTKRRHPLSFGLRMVQSLINRVEIGHLTIETPTGVRLSSSQTAEPGPVAVLILHRWRALRRIAMAGDIGFADGYIDGDWSSPTLTALIELAALNQERLAREFQGMATVRLFHWLYHLSRANTKTGSRRNIVAHYDLGNDFYSTWLDQGMSYSSALYTSADQTLESAQIAKQDRVLELLDPRSGDKILEIGCGWGGLAERLVEHTDCSVTGVTLSPAQLEYAQERLAGRADLRFQDYRDTDGIFDKVVSIEMFEAVGAAYWPVFFETLRKRLKPNGIAVLQVITIDHVWFDEYRRTVDFIQRYIFPGGLMPSREALCDEFDRAGFRLTHSETFGQSYARTLAEWRERFHRAWPAIASMGYAANFKRLWEYYLSYCEAGFRDGRINVGLYRIERVEAAG